MVNEDFSLPTFWMKHITAVLVLFTYIDYQFCSEHESFWKFVIFFFFI